MKINKDKIYRFLEMYISNIVVFTIIVIVFIGLLSLLGETCSAGFAYWVIGIMFGGAVLTLIDYTK